MPDFVMKLFLWIGIATSTIFISSILLIVVSFLRQGELRSFKDAANATEKLTDRKEQVNQNLKTYYWVAVTAWKVGGTILIISALYLFGKALF